VDRGLSGEHDRVGEDRRRSGTRLLEVSEVRLYGGKADSRVSATRERARARSHADVASLRGDGDAR
jgi:hypothetical protein